MRISDWSSDVCSSDLDVSAGQWRFLRQLWREDGITQRELSERVGMREPTTVVALKGLEKAGFITRKKTAEDRRKTFIHLTPHRSEEHTSELQSLMRISYAVFCLNKKTIHR